MMKNIEIDYTPQPKQQELHASPANETLYGGAAGPGKSHALRFETLKWCLAIPNLQAYLFRRLWKELEKTHVIPSQVQFPREAGEFKESKKRWDFSNGSMLHFCYAQYEKDVFTYQGAEIHLLVIDELTTFTEFMYDYLRSRVRCTLDIPKEFRHKIPGIICGSNPGGVGHEFAKRRWVDFAKPMELKRASKREGGMLRQYIPGKLEDNPILLKNDPDYIHRLDALPEPYRSAYKDGDWDIFMGQIFAFNEMDHVIEPMPVPDNAPLYMTFDWGFGKPYSIGWWWVDDDGRVYRFHELYGCMNGQTDTGVRQTDEEIAEEILIHEEQQGIKGRRITRLCDPTCFNKKPNYDQGGQTPSTAEVFAKKGVYLSKGDPNRLMKIRQFHQRLRVKKDKEGNTIEPPMMLVYKTCVDFIRTIPLLQADEKNPEDVDTRMEDHIYDEAAHICMARPIGGQTLVTDDIFDKAAL